MNQQLRGKRIAILAGDGFEEAELLLPKAALEDQGAMTFVISPKQGESIQAMKHDIKTIQVRIDLPLEEAVARDFDALLLPGGALNADSLRMVPKAQEFVRVLDRMNKPMAIICHAPWLLVSSGLVSGRRMTSYYTIADDIRNAGGLWEDKEVVRSGNWVTSRMPSDIPAFNREMIRLISESDLLERSGAIAF